MTNRKVSGPKKLTNCTKGTGTLDSPKVTDMFNSFLEDFPLAFFVVDNHWNISQFNAAAEKALGRKKGQVIGELLWNSFPIMKRNPYYQQLHMAKQSFKPLSFSAYYSDLGVWFKIQACQLEAGLYVYLQDITKEKLAKEALFASEERFKAAFEYAPIGMALLSLDGNFLKVNRSLCLLVGYSVTEFLSMKLSDLFFTEGLTHRNQGDREVENLVFRREYQFRHKQGYPVWVMVNSTLIKNDEGNPLSVIMQVEDISERKEVEQALKRGEAKFRSYIERSLDGIHIVDETGKYVEVNPVGAAMFGYTEEEVLGMQIGDIIAPGQSDGFDHFKALVEIGSSKGEITCKKKDGSIVKAEINAVALGNGRFMGILRDITARKEAEEMLLASEERFRFAFNYAPIGMALVSLDGHFIKVNKSLTDMLGYSKHELLDKKFQEITHPSDIDENVNFRQRLVSGEIQNYWTEKRYLHKSGKAVHCLLSATVIRDKEGKPLYFVSQILDITEQKTVMQALSEREQMYRALFEKAANPILVIDKNGNYIDCNREAQVFMECNKEELLSHTIDSFEILSNSEIVADPSFYWNQGGTVETHYTVNGKKKVLDLTITPIIWQGKEAVIGIGRDITKQKEDEQALRESEERYRRLVEYFPNTISVVNKGKILYINNAGTKLLEASDKESVISKQIDSIIHPDFIKLVENMICSTNQNNSVGVSEAKVVSIKGTPIDVEISVIPFDYRGQTMVQLIIEDITKSKQTEGQLATEKQRLAATIRSIGEGVITADREGIIVLANKAAEELTGWSLEQMIGNKLEDVITVKNEKTLQTSVNSGSKVLKTGKQVSLREPKILVARDGKKTTIEDIATPIYSDGKELIGVVLVFYDISDQRKIEEEFAKVEKLESLGILAGGIAHDFNNILTVILGNISLVRMLVPSGIEVQEQLEDMEKATVHARNLTKQLLTFAKGGAPILRTASAKELIKQTTVFMLRGSNVKCETCFPEDLWNVEVDENQISQVINNLVINAKQAMPDGGILTIKAVNEIFNSHKPLPLKDGKYVKITIEDTGCGIADEHLPRIFDPYYTTKPRGNGLGLSTAYSIVKKHNGHIAVESKAGKGTKFTIYLPASERKMADEDLPGSAIVRGTGKVLLMDDEGPIRYIAGKMLSQVGYEVSEAIDGDEAIELYKLALASGKPFDLLIMDLTVPGGMGGREAVKIIKQINPRAKAIVSSGYSNDPIMANYAAFGFDGVVAKPYKIDELTKVVYSLIKEGENN